MTTAPKTILVVDDEQNIRLMLRSALETDGFVVREAADGEEAIASIEREMPALVLLDLWMQRSNGMTVLEHLNQKPPQQRPRVIVLTAHGRVPVVVKAMRLGASDFLEKPTTPEDLRLSVAAALEDQADAENEAQAAVADAPRANPKLSPSLWRIRRAIWNQDIHFTEHVLNVLFRKAWGEPSYFNLLGAVFEAEGNRGAAKSFYQKAAISPAGRELASHNLRRLDELAADAADVADVELGEQEKYLDEICAQREMNHAEPTQQTLMNKGNHS
ncbi:MAG: response regulator [Tepidisphaeraceae bacterium]